MAVRGVFRRKNCTYLGILHFGRANEIDVEKLGWPGKNWSGEKWDVRAHIRMQHQLTTTTDYDEFFLPKLFFQRTHTHTHKFPQQSQWNLCSLDTAIKNRNRIPIQTSRGKKRSSTNERVHSVCWSIKSKLNYGLFGRLYLMPFWNWVFLRNEIENFHLPFGNFLPRFNFFFSPHSYSSPPAPPILFFRVVYFWKKFDSRDKFCRKTNQSSDEKWSRSEIRVVKWLDMLSVTSASKRTHISVYAELCGF